MSRKQALGLFLLVLIPTLFLGWFGLKASYEDKERAHQNTRSLLQVRLEDTKVLIRRIVEQVERRLIKQTESWDGNIQFLRELQRKHPLVRQAFWVDASGMLRYPAQNEILTASEQEFFHRTRPIWEGKAILVEPEPDQERSQRSLSRTGKQRPIEMPSSSTSAPKVQRKQASPSRQHTYPSRQNAFPPQTSHSSPWFGQSVPMKPSQTQTAFSGKSRPQFASPKKTGWGDSILDLAAGRLHGWIVWYWAEGLHLLFWMRTAQGQIVGVEIDRVVLTARLVGNLPDSTPQSTKHPGLLVLKNERGSTLYQWGNYQAEPKEGPIVQVALPYPLHSWQLVYLGPEQKLMQQRTGRMVFHQIILLGGVVLALMILAFYLYRELSRDMQEAAQRVNFVTQVSHELKTPLTNIRLYAELLEGRISEEDARARRHVHVIVAESQRLSRLINNILTFSRQQRKQHKIHKVSCVLDDVIKQTVEQFQPTLQAKGIDVECDLHATQPVWADPDAIEQILNNLLSNVEKYASSGKWVAIRSWQTPAGDVSMEVEDRGPGVPKSLRDSVFLPFVRGSDQLSDGVTGTGIGLTIARDLARMQGGDLSLMDSSVGSRFVLCLPSHPSEPRS